MLKKITKKRKFNSLYRMLFVIKRLIVSFLPNVLHPSLLQVKANKEGKDAQLFVSAPLVLQNFTLLPLPSKNATLLLKMFQYFLMAFHNPTPYPSHFMGLTPSFFPTFFVDIFMPKGLPFLHKTPTPFGIARLY